MNKKLKLLALDLDGTLLTDDNTISEATKSSIHQAIEQGIIVCFATGRGVQTSSAYVEELGLTGPMVFVNGAEVRRNPKEVWKRTFIDQNDLRRLSQLAIENGARFWGYSVDDLILSKDWTPELLTKNWLKFGISTQNPIALKEMWETINGWGTLEVTQAARTNMEITVKGVNKEYGIREVCDFLSIDMDEVMAIGDSLNDYHLISSAGLGVAMGNAFDELKKVADVTTDSNEDDGVAKAINRYLLHR